MLDGAQELVERALDTVTEAVGGPARRRIIVVLACALALESADATTVGASASQLRQALHISNTELGLLVTTSSIVGALATIPFGVLVDRTKRTRLLAIAAATWGLAMAVSATVGSYQQLLGIRVFLGAATAAAGPSIASLIGDYFPTRDRGRVYGFVLTGELVGAGVGFVGAGALAAVSWRAPFLLLTLPAWALSLQLWRLPEPRRKATAGQQLGLLAAIRYVLRIRTNVILILTGACGYFFFAGVRTFGVEFVRLQYGLGQAVASGLALVLGVGAVAGVLVSGRLSDRLLRRGRLSGRIAVAVAALFATSVIFVPALLARVALVAVPFLVLAAFALAATNPPMDAARLDIVPPRLWGRAEAIRTTFRLGAQAAAPLVFGLVADHAFGGGRAGLQAAFLVMLGPLALSAGILLTALRTYPRDVAAVDPTQRRAVTGSAATRRHRPRSRPARAGRAPAHR